MKLSEMSKQNKNAKQEGFEQKGNVAFQGNYSNKLQEKTSSQKSVNEAYEELKGCTSDELMSRLAKEVQAQKANGTFDYEGLKNSVEQIRIYLPNQTYENMMRIIESLK